MRSGQAPRGRLFRVLATGLGVIVALALAELVLRVGARVSPDVRHLATAGVRRTLPPFESLAEFLAWQSDHVQPHRPWFNRWNNAVGLHDQEFTLPKPPGRFRILAVGDSFTYGLVPYEDAAMTVVETRLQQACSGKDLDLLNLGIGGTDVGDYRRVVSLALAEYEPDLVVVHFYAGNDAPDLFRHAHDRSPAEALLRHSYTWTYGKNVLKLRRGGPDTRLARRVERDPAASHGRLPRGGAIIDPDYRIPDDDAMLVGPTFPDEAFERMLAGELGRLYVPRDAGEVTTAWRSVLDELEATRILGSRTSTRMAFVVFPSVLQVYPDRLSALVDALRTRRRHAPLSLADIDPRLPNRILAEYCRATGIPCLDVTDALVMASRESSEPLYKQRDTHWTPRGNRVAAEAEAAGLVPLVCPAPSADDRVTPTGDSFSRGLVLRAET